MPATELVGDGLQLTQRCDGRRRHLLVAKKLCGSGEPKPQCALPREVLNAH